MKTIMEQAVENSRIIGDRYVPAPENYPETGGKWCVVDAHMEVIIATGHTFDNALSLASEYSVKDKVQQLEKV